MTNFPNWGIFTQFLNLKLHNKIAEDYELYFSALKLCCELSDKAEFISQIQMVSFLTNFKQFFDDGLFGSNAHIAKGLVLTIIGNFLTVQGEDTADRVNKLLRNKKFGFIQFTQELMKPYTEDNTNNEAAASIIEFYNMVVDTPLFKNLYESNLAEFDEAFMEMLMTVKNGSGRFADAITEFCEQIKRIYQDDGND